MKKIQPKIFKDGVPNGTDHNQSTFYDIGFVWHDTLSGIEYLHKSNTIWEKIILSSNLTGTLNTLPKYTADGLTNSSITDNGTIVNIGENVIVAGDLTGNTLTLNNGSVIVNYNEVKIFEISPSFSGSLLEVSDVDNNIVFSIDNTTESILSVIDTNTSNVFNIQADGTIKQNSVTRSAITSASSPYSVFSISKTSCNAIFFDYFVKETGTSAYRCGTVMCIQDGTTSTYTDIATSDLNASTSGIVFSTTFISSNIVLIATITSGTWNIKIGARKL